MEEASKYTPLDEAKQPVVGVRIERQKTLP